MAREIIILEQLLSTNRENGYADCIFVYPSEFIRLGTKYPITSLLELSPALLAVFTTAEQSAIADGDLSYQQMGRILIPRRTNEAERKQRLRRKYRKALEIFTVNIVDPKSFDVEYVGVPT